MERQAVDLLRDALALSPDTRAELIDSLIESLDQSVEEGGDEIWAQEVEHRVGQIDSGAVELVYWAHARERLRKRLHQRG